MSVNTTVRKYTRKIVTRQIMQLRIAKAKNLRAQYNELQAMIVLDTIPANVRTVLKNSAFEVFTNLQKAERKVIVSVQKKLAEDFTAAEILFDSFSDRWMNDPSHTIVEAEDSENDSDDAEDDEDVNDDK